MNPLAEHLVALREAAGNPTYRSIAETSGVSLGAIHKTMAGTAWPGRERAIAIGAALGGDRAEIEALWDKGDALIMRMRAERSSDATAMLACLHAMLDGGPVPVATMAALPADAAAAIARVADRLGVPLEVGTIADWTIGRRATVD